MADSGTIVVMMVGQSVSVALGGRGFVSWHVPGASGTALRRTAASGGYPGSRPARAAFRAVRPGRSALSSVTDAAGLHAAPACEIPQQVWQVTVIVRS